MPEMHGVQRTKNAVAVEGSPSISQSATSDTMAQTAAENELVTFKVRDRLFGIDIQDVQSVVKTIDITRVPYAAPSILGVINLRGNITPILDIAHHFKLGNSTITEKSRIIILQFAEHMIGFLVDEVTNIMHAGSEAMESPPRLISQGLSREYIKSIVKLNEESGILVLLNAKLISDQIKTSPGMA